MRTLIIMLLAILIRPSDSKSQSTAHHKELIIFHAGSLAIPIKQAAREYEKRIPVLKYFLNQPEALFVQERSQSLKSHVI